MEKTIKTITLSDCEVDIATHLTWGEKEDIQGIIMNGANVTGDGLRGYNTGAIRESKYKALEICVREIRKNGEKSQFSREWMDNLSLEDGSNLYEFVDEVVNPKKK